MSKRAEPLWLTDDDERVICGRHFGPEGATKALLAKVFGVHQNYIAMILRQHRAKLRKSPSPTTGEAV